MESLSAQKPKMLEVITARRTESLDAASIIKLVNSGTDALFGRINVVNLIEKAVLAVTLCNSDEDVLGHAAFFDYPNLPGVDPADWETWLNATYDCSKCTAINTLFLHYFVAKPEYSHGCASEIIRTVYNAIPELHYCYLVVPTGVYPEAALSSVFNELEHRPQAKALENCSIFVCRRYEHAPVLHVRPARVRDHDDLTPIFNRQSTMLLNTYGEYFLAELIEAQDETMQCIVAEVDGAAIGFMSLTTEVDIDLLNDCFELGTFHGLRKPHKNDILKRDVVEEFVQGSTASRPTSGKSNNSAVSKNSLEGAPPGSATLGGSGKSSRAGSQRGDDVKIRIKLTDEAADGTGSILSDTVELESVKSGGDAPPSEPMQVHVEMPVLPPVADRFVPTYHGAASCFAIQLFVIDEKFEMRSVDFLLKAFDLFPDRDFCIISVPHLVPEFPLIQQFVQVTRIRITIPLHEYKSGLAPEARMALPSATMSRVTPRSPSALTQELYVFCRMGLHRDFSVRFAYESDTDSISNLVGELYLHEKLLEDLTLFHQYRRDPDGTQIQAFVAQVAGQIVGVAILRKEQDIEFIRSHYNIEDFIYYNHHRRNEHGHLHHYALNPMFRHFSKHFLKEILRIGHKTCLYYPLYPNYVDQEVLGGHSLIAALSELVPVRARRQIIYPLEELGKNGPSERVLKNVEPFALSHINRKLTLEPKVVINASIVVVGASDVSIALLESFSFCPHLRFNNLTLISPHGLPGELPPNEIRSQMLATSHCYSQEDYARMSLRSWVNVVYGKMTAIDRKKKHVVVNNNTIVPYDHLILATGLQYQVPMPTGVDIVTGMTTAETETSPDRRFSGVPSRNVFIVNDAFDAGVALNWVETNIVHSEGRILLYGHSIDAFTSIQSFMIIGVPGSRIDLVLPPLGCEVDCFNDPDITRAIMSALTSAGVTIYTDYVLAQWNDGVNVEEVTTVSFTSSHKPIALECQAFFGFYKKQVDYDAFKAINDACLVFDGRLVLDANFHTNDVSIRGAGPLTKFQRIYHSDQWSHANFNSKEVGIQLANALLTLFDPTLEPESPPPRDLLKLIPIYRSPKICGCFLPGEYHYLFVGKPKLNTPLEALRSQSDFGVEMVTGSIQGDPDYFRLHLNQYKSVEDITCLSKKPFPTSNLMCLYNIHERFLNNLTYRYEVNLISDFYKFFQDKGLMAVYHDRYPDFREEVRELLVTRPEPNRESLEEKIRQMFEDDITPAFMQDELNESQLQYLKEEFVQSGAKRAVETRLLSFLSYNTYHLPMYAKPGMV